MSKCDCGGPITTRTSKTTSSGRRVSYCRCSVCGKNHGKKITEVVQPRSIDDGKTCQDSCTTNGAFQMHENKEFLNPAELAEFLGIDPSAVEGLDERGYLPDPVYLPGKEHRDAYARRQILAWLACGCPVMDSFKHQEWSTKVDAEYEVAWKQFEEIRARRREAVEAN